MCGGVLSCTTSCVHTDLTKQANRLLTQAFVRLSVHGQKFSSRFSSTTSRCCEDCRDGCKVSPGRGEGSESCSRGVSKSKFGVRPGVMVEPIHWLDSVRLGTHSQLKNKEQGCSNRGGAFLLLPLLHGVEGRGVLMCYHGWPFCEGGHDAVVGGYAPHLHGALRTVCGRSAGPGAGCTRSGGICVPHLSMMSPPPLLYAPLLYARLLYAPHQGSTVGKKSFRV